jgi:hypothetical protein
MKFAFGFMQAVPDGYEPKLNSSIEDTRVKLRQKAFRTFGDQTLGWTTKCDFLY